MQTTHRIDVGDARTLDIEPESVDLVVTSPPYPMIEMWDEVFTALDPEIGTALNEEDGQRAFDRMHDVLDAVWAELERVLVPGGIAAINVGDATRSMDGSFRLYPNHARIVSELESVGLDPLPDVLWRKPTNSAAKFMGSGTQPPNAYVTLEHEFILLARKSGMRRPERERRRRSAYFWEERNEWFSDVWEIRGERQVVDSGPRDRTGAFPFDIPYRLVNMYSVQGDTVLDPFWGTGTTTLASMASARNSIGVEIDPELAEAFDPIALDVESLTHERSSNRLAAHREFVDAREDPPKYEAEHYDTRVITKQEREIRLPTIESVESTAAGWTVGHGFLED